MTTPVRRGTVDVDARTVSYRRCGAGAAVRLVGSPTHSCAPDVPRICEPARTHTVIAVDPPGHGFSDPLPGGDLAAELVRRDPGRFPLSVWDDVLPPAETDPVPLRDDGGHLQIADWLEPAR